MKLLLPAALALMLAACGGSGDDTLGDQAATAAENRADALEDQADNAGTERQEDSLEDQAEAVRETGQGREEAIDDSDIDAGALSNRERGAMVNGS